MDAYNIVFIIFLIIACASIVGCIIATLLVWLDYFKMKKEYEEEIEHLKKEVRACRLILKKRSTQDGS